MQFSAAIVLVLSAFIGSGLALLCRNCISSKSFDHCELMGEVQQCNATIVNANHANLVKDNPNLQPGNGTEFKCFRISVARNFDNGTDTGLRGYSRGCTFNSTDFCSGWDNTLNVTSCGTCTTDNCDQNPVASTVAPSGTTTTLAPGAGTSTTATTNTPSTGGSNVLQIGTSTLAFVTIVSFLARHSNAVAA